MAVPTDAPGYYGLAREDFAEFIPHGLDRVLDVGCGSGGFGRTLMRQGKAREMWGIELHPAAAQQASATFARVESGDAMELLARMPPAHFDAVTFSDVLEHFAWPDEALRRTRPLLKPGAPVLASVPNIRYFHALWEILWKGEFRYRDSGIFDETHLRFFTLKTIPGWFARAGFRVESIRGMNPTPSAKFRLLNRLLRRRFEDCRFLQFAVVARPAAV